MTGRIPTDQDTPLDLAAYQHHLLLLKSMHCARPLIHNGLQQFIKALTLNDSGGDTQMIVYLAGKKGGVDGRQIEIISASYKRVSCEQSTESQF